MTPYTYPSELRDQRQAEREYGRVDGWGNPVEQGELLPRGEVERGLWKLAYPGLSAMEQTTQEKAA